METNRVAPLEALELIDLKQIFALVRKRLWLILLGGLLGAGLAALYSFFQQPVYEASTNVLVTQSAQNQSTDIIAGANPQQTAATYVQFLSMEPVLNMVSERVGYKIDPEGDTIHVNQVPNTQIISVTVEDTDGQRAALIADTLVQVLIEQNEILQAGRYADSETSLQAQILEMEKQIDGIQDQVDAAKAAALQAQIQNIQTEIDKVQMQLEELEADSSGRADQAVRRDQLEALMSSYYDAYTERIVSGEIQGTDEHAARLEKSLELYQQLYLGLLSNLESVRMARMQNTPNVVQTSPALIADKPIRPRPVLYIVLGGLAGLMLAFSLVVLLEYLDDSIKTREDVERLGGPTVLSYIGEVSEVEKKQGHLNVARQPRSPVAEAFRSLRANLEFAGVDHHWRTILVTSAGPGEGKSTVAANLAAIIAQGGRRAILLDADLRKPAVHLFFDLANRAGLSDLFRDRLGVSAVMHSLNPDKSLSAITTGSLPPNPTELLASEKMDVILAELKQQDAVIILDSAPAIVSDAQVLAAKVDAVLIVVQPGKTHRDELQNVLEQFKRAGAHVAGVVFNHVPHNRSSYYNEYGKYSPYLYGGSQTDATVTVRAPKASTEKKE